MERACNTDATPLATRNPVFSGLGAEGAAFFQLMRYMSQEEQTQHESYKINNRALLSVACCSHSLAADFQRVLSGFFLSIAGFQRLSGFRQVITCGFCK